MAQAHREGDKGAFHDRETKPPQANRLLRRQIEERRKGSAPGRADDAAWRRARGSLEEGKTSRIRTADQRMADVAGLMPTPRADRSYLGAGTSSMKARRPAAVKSPSVVLPLRAHLTICLAARLRTECF